MVNLVFQPKVPVVWPPAANVCGASVCPMEAAFLQGWGRLCKSGGIKFRRTCPEAVGWIMSGQLRVANLKLVKTEFPIRSRMNGMKYPSRETSLSLFSLLFFFFRNGEGKTKKGFENTRIKSMDWDAQRCGHWIALTPAPSPYQTTKDWLDGGPHGSDIAPCRVKVTGPGSQV